MKVVNIAAPKFAYDPEDPDGFHGGLFRCGPLVGPTKLGASL